MSGSCSTETDMTHGNSPELKVRILTYLASAQL